MVNNVIDATREREQTRCSTSVTASQNKQWRLVPTLKILYIIWMQPLLNIPVVVPPPHHVLIVGGGRDLKPLDVFIGAKKEGIIPRCVV